MDLVDPVPMSRRGLIALWGRFVLRRSGEALLIAAAVAVGATAGLAILWCLFTLMMGVILTAYLGV